MCIRDSLTAVAEAVAASRADATVLRTGRAALASVTQVVATGVAEPAVQGAALAALEPRVADPVAAGGTLPAVLRTACAGLPVGAVAVATGVAHAAVGHAVAAVLSFPAGVVTATFAEPAVRRAGLTRLPRTARAIAAVDVAHVAVEGAEVGVGAATGRKDEAEEKDGERGARHNQGEQSSIHGGIQAVTKLSDDRPATSPGQTRRSSSSAQHNFTWPQRGAHETLAPWPTTLGLVDSWSTPSQIIGIATDASPQRSEKSHEPLISHALETIF